MAKLVKINSLEDPRIEYYMNLTESQLRNRLEPEKGILIAESIKVICTALESGVSPVSFLMPEKHFYGQAASVLSRYPDVPVFTAEDDLLEHLTGYRLTRGILCAMKRPGPHSATSVLSNSHRIAVLENIVDATNIGAIFRSAAALGIDGILVAPNCCDPYNRRSTRVSMGTVFQIPWAYICENTDVFYEQGLTLLRQKGYRTVAMALSKRSISFEAPELQREERMAIVLGAEGEGLSDFVLEQCDDTITIPMYHGVDSLNVAAASAVAFWQLRYKAAQE